jgi:hypothetical protein
MPSDSMSTAVIRYSMFGSKTVQVVRRHTQKYVVPVLDSAVGYPECCASSRVIRE